MIIRGIISPPRSGSSPRRRRSYNSKPIIDNPNEPHKSQGKQTQPATAKMVSTSPRTETPSPKVHKKSHNYSNSNSTTKIKPITQPTTPLPTSFLSSAVKPTAMAKNELGQQNYHPNYTTTLHHLPVPDCLQHVPIHGKDLTNIVLGGNSIYESMRSSTKEESSSQSNELRMLQIYKEIASHHQGNSSITSYFTKLKALWDELATLNTNLPECSCGGAIVKLSEHIERQKVIQFLVGLNDSYSTVCNQILDLTKPFPTVKKAYSALIREEKRRKLVVAKKLHVLE